jgi:DNA-binding XRE family transcriptional regulator
VDLEWFEATFKRITVTESTQFVHLWRKSLTILAPPQVRMARAALGISVRELAKSSGVAESTILRFETGRGGILATNLDKVQTCLEDGGVIFISADAGGGPGVRLRS